MRMVRALRVLVGRLAPDRSEAAVFPLRLWSAHPLMTALADRQTDWVTPDICALVAAALAIVELRPNGVKAAWVAALWPALGELVERGATQYHFPARYRVELRCLRAVVQMRTSGLRQVLPDAQEHPLATALHGAFTPCAGATARLMALYSVYCVPLHEALLWLHGALREGPERFDPDQETRNLYDYATSLRLLVPHLDSQGPEWQAGTITPGHARRAIDRFASDPRICRLKRVTIAKHVRRLEVMLIDRTRPEPGTTRDPDVEEHVGVAPLDPTEAESHERSGVVQIDAQALDCELGIVAQPEVTQRVTVNSGPVHVLAEGGSPLEEAVDTIVYESEQALSPYEEVLKLRYIQAAQARECAGSVAASPIGLRALQQLKDAAAARTLVGNAGASLTTAMLTVDFHIPGERLLAAQWVDRAPAIEERRLYVDLDEEQFLYCLSAEDIGWRKRPLPGGEELYLPASDIVRVPLSRGHMAMLRTMRANAAPGDPWVLCPPAQAAVFCEEVEDELERLLGQQVTLSQLRRAGRLWMGAMGYQRVEAALVSGAPTFVERPTLFYVNTSASWLAQVLPPRWGALSRLGREALPDGVAAFHEPGIGGSDTRRYGSRLVALHDAVRPRLRILRSRLRSLASASSVPDRIRYINVGWAYVILVVFWATGARPTAAMFRAIARRLRDAQGVSWLFVADKDNRIHQEARVIPLAEPAAQVLEAWEARVRDVREPLVARGLLDTSRLRDDREPFWIDGQRAIPLDERGLREVLRREGLEDAYPFPLYCSRHTWVTEVFHSDIPLDLIDPYLGHVHHGHETLAWYSLQPHRRAVQPFLDIAHRILTGIGGADPAAVR
jgi:integrase